MIYKMEELDVEPYWVGEVVHDLPGGEWRRLSLLEQINFGGSLTGQVPAQPERLGFTTLV